MKDYSDEFFIRSGGDLETVINTALSEQKKEFCLCDAIPRKVKLEVIEALEEDGSGDSIRMLKLLKSCEG